MNSYNRVAIRLKFIQWFRPVYIHIRSVHWVCIELFVTCRQYTKYKRNALNHIILPYLSFTCKKTQIKTVL